MLQRGLAILLSVCMLAGGTGDTVYAMSPQSDAGTVSAVQNVLDTREISELSTEDAISDPAVEDERKSEEDQAGNGMENGSEIGGEESDASGSEATDDGNTEDGDNTTGDVADSGDNTTGDSAGSESDAEQGGTEDNNDSDAAVNEDEDEAEDISGSKAEDIVDEPEAAVSVLSIKEEELTLTVDAPQTVTLAEDEKQWLSFTAPQDGLFRFYSTTEDDSWQYKYVYLFHEKSNYTYDSFAHGYGNGKNGNFSCAYRMQKGETVYLLVSYDDSETNGTFTVNAEEVEAEELSVTKTDEGNYSLTSRSYCLNLVMTPSYSRVKVVAELRQADGSALAGSSSYSIYYQCFHDDSWGGKSEIYDEMNLYSPGYQNKQEYAVASGGELLITELQIRDSSGNILASFGAGEHAISVNTLTTDKQGVLTQVTAEDTSITVEAEMISNTNGRLRYRKKEEAEWSYHNDLVYYYASNEMTFPAEPDTDYVVELTAMDMETVYDTKEIRTKAFAASDIKAEVMDITSTSATIRVTVGAYTGNKRYIRARVSYINSMGISLTNEDYMATNNIASGSINLSLRDLAAGTEYKDLEVELDDTNSYYDSMQYVAYRTKVTFTTAASAITAEQINVTATPDAEDGTRAVLKVALNGVTEESYQYTVIYRVAGCKDWRSNGWLGKLAADNNYAEEQDMYDLVGDTKYEVLVLVDGITKTTSFTTASAGVTAAVEVKPLMQGVQVTAALTGTEALSGTYTISVQYYDQSKGIWNDAYCDDTDYDSSYSSYLTADNNWKTTAVFKASNIRPNAENDWRIYIFDVNKKGVYEKYVSLKVASQEISLTAENITCTTARIKAVLAARDESIQYNSAYIYYRAKGAEQWIYGDSCSYTYESGDTVYLSGLKEDTEYEVKLVPDLYPEDILAQTTFRTLKDTRRLSVSVDNCRYTSAQVSWTFDSGANVLNDYSYIFIYYREKGVATWTFVDNEWVRTTNSGKKSLTDLEAGTTYEVLVELKDDYNTVAVQNVVRDAKTEFTTAVIDHELKAESVENGTEVTSVTFDILLSKKTGKLEHSAKAVVTLESAVGSMQSKTVNLDKENQYKAKVKISDLLPNTKYTVYAELYELENNEWIRLRDFTLGEVTTAEAKAPTTLTISETEFALNKGTSKKLTVTAQPQEAAVGLIWTSSDETVATVERDGTVTAHKAGKADITVSAASVADGGKEKVSAVSHVTVRDYVIRVKNADGSYDSIQSLLTKTQKRTLVVYDNTAEKDLTGVTWSCSNPNAARISADGLLEPQNYGQANITAKTEEGIILKESIEVVNEIQGFSITKPENYNNSYRAIRTAEAVYQVAAGETYRVGCVLSPAYTEQYHTSVSIPGDRFDWSAENNAVTVKVSEYDSEWTDITIPAGVSGAVKVSAVMKDEEYKDKNFTITLEVLKKPEVETLPATYTWLDYSSKLQDVGLPENWQWKEQDTLIYETGMKTFTARYTQSGYYPYETGVNVYAEKIGNSFSVTGANYSTGKKAYIVKKETPLKVKIDALGGSIPTLLYEQSALASAAKDAAKVSVSARDGAGYYSVTASAKGTYTVSAAISLKKAAFEKQGGAYVLTAGADVKSTTASVKFMAVDSAPINKITFAVAADSPEKVTLAGDGTIEYEITAANADTKNNQRVIYLDVTATDTDGNVVENPNINYAVSDTAVVKQKNKGTNQLELTIPKGADGLAKIVATAKDDLGYSTELAVRVKDYTPRVTTNKITINENYTSSKPGIAQVALPYLEENDDRINELSLVETNSQEGKDKVAGLEVTTGSMYNNYKYSLSLRVTDKEQIKKKGNVNYYLAITTKAYGGTVFVPVQIKIETGIPAVTLKQSNKVNVFYTDTTHLSSYDYDAVSMGLVDVSSTASIESVRWVAGDGNEAAANTEFVIEKSYSSVWKNGKNTRKYMIQQHRPILNSSKKPSDAAVKGKVFVRLSGYSQEVEIPLTIQTVYKKPKLKVADYKVCPALEKVTDYQDIYTNAAKTNNYLMEESPTVWRGYSDVICADEEIEVVNSYSNVGLRYSGTKDKNAQLTFYSDYWYESLSVPVKVKVVKSQVKLSPATVTLNTAYPSETTQTTATTEIYNAATGTYVAMSDVRIESANSKAQELLDKNLLNINMDKRMWYSSSNLKISVNYAKAMGSDQIKPGSYKFNLTPYYGDTELNRVTLTVKVIDKEATVKVAAKGTIDLLKLNWNGDGYNNYSNDYSNNYVTVTPTFKNLDSSYYITDVELEGAYKNLFEICTRYSGGSLRIVPRSVGKLKAGKSYQLSVTYTVKDAYGEGGETIKVTSNTFTIKPKQSVPKVTASVKQLTLYACAKGESKAETMSLYVPHDSKKGYYAIQNANGSLDVNKDGKADLIVKTSSIDESSGRATIAVYVLDADAVKATAKGVAYKIPVTVRCVGRDGVSKDASTTVSVVVKK